MSANGVAQVQYFGDSEYAPGTRVIDGGEMRSILRNAERSGLLTSYSNDAEFDYVSLSDSAGTSYGHYHCRHAA